MIAVVASAMVFSAKRDSGVIRRLLTKPMRTGMRRLNTASRTAHQTRLGSDPCQVFWISDWFHLFGTSPPHVCSQCRQNAHPRRLQSIEWRFGEGMNRPTHKLLRFRVDGFGSRLDILDSEIEEGLLDKLGDWVFTSVSIRPAPFARGVRCQ